MRKKLIIILSLILLISLAAGCSSGNTEDITSTSASATETVSEASTTTATTTTSTTKATTTTKAITTAKTENSTTSTTKKAVSASKAKATKDKKTHTQINSFCYITVECSSILDNMNNLKEGHESFVPKSGEIISKTKCTFKENDSAYDILEKICERKNIKLSARDTVYGIYVVGINNLDEFDCGTASGWVYTVNGKSPSYTCGKYKVSVGDEIVFKYVC